MDPRQSSLEYEAPKDPGLNQHHSSTAIEVEDHRQNLYLGLHIPSQRRRSKHHKHKHHHKNGETIPENNRPITPPSERVQFILGEKDEEYDESHVSHPIFSEMETLCEMENGNLEWKETARWVKFEEDVEEGGERWSKPHVSTLSLHSLFELRSLVLNSTVMLDMDAFSLVQITDLLVENMVNQGQLPYQAKEKFQTALHKNHKHLYEKKHHHTNGSKMNIPIIKSLADLGKHSNSASKSGTNHSDSNLETSLSQGSITNAHSGNQLDGHEHKGNVHFMRKIQHGSEAANILVGEVNFLEKPIAAFVRLAQGATLGNMVEVNLPTRFIFIMLGPKGGLPRYHEIGRSMATLFSDEVFHDVAYKAKNRNHLLAGIDEFLDAVTILPPGEWDPSIRIEPPAAIPSQESRKNKLPPEIIDEEEEEKKLRQDSGLARTGRCFGGLLTDIKRKIPWYLSDYKDGISVQSVASFFFLYFACLTPIITFGGLLGEATDNNIAAMESLVSGLICGVIYGLFSGQPLTILGSTGPVLVFEQILFDFCKSQGWDYLEFRLWVGLWAAAILIILVAVDASALVCYITRFTEENFATLIAFIFIFKAVQKVIKIGEYYPMATHVDDIWRCVCLPPDETISEPFNATLHPSINENYTLKECDALSYNFTWTGVGEDDCNVAYKADVFPISLILFFGTFFISLWLKNFKTASFFPTSVRGFISDFAVIIAILAMTAADIAIGIHTPKLKVPAEFKPTKAGRGWVVPPFAYNPVWSPLVAAVPALLAVILLFMDQQITAVIVNRKEHKLKKGGGYHLDLFILAILTAINSIMGLPWFVAATVLSINHVNSLKKESECAAPGEKPKFLGVRENRLTHVLIFVFIGLSVLMTPILSKIPMAVLFGVFLYMGFAALKGIQLFDRILIMFMPLKYQPDYAFLRQMPLKRIHMFTFIQLTCLAVLWTIKSFSQTSILFPLMLVFMVGVRKLLDWVFTQRELKILDDALPEFSRRKRVEIEEMVDDDDDDNDDVKHERANSVVDTKEGMVTIPLASGNVMKVPMPINISEEMNKSGVWQDINCVAAPTEPKYKKSKKSSCESCNNRHYRKSGHNKHHKKPSESGGYTNGYIIPIAEESEELANEINFNKKPKSDLTSYELDSLNDISEGTAKKRGSKNDAKHADEKRRLSMTKEEDEDDMGGIQIKVTKPFKQP